MVTHPTWSNCCSSPLRGPMSKTNVNYSWLKGTKCVNRAVYLTRVQPAKLNITCAPYSLSFPSSSFFPSILFPSFFFFDQREREIDGCYPGPIFASREGSSRKMSIPETANVVVLRQGLVVTFHAPRSVIADTHPSPRRATANYCPLHRDALPLRRQFHAEIHCEIIRRREGERERGRRRVGGEGGRGQCVNIASADV